MSIISRARKQTAVWWSQGAIDGFGKATVCDPVEVECRWDDRVEEFINHMGSPQRSKSWLMVDATLDFKIGDIVLLGTIGDLDDPDTATNNEGAWAIQGIKDTPNLRNTETLRQLIL